MAKPIGPPWSSFIPKPTITPPYVDQTQRAGERQSEGAGTGSYTVTKVDDQGNIHQITIDIKSNTAYQDVITGNVHSTGSGSAVPSLGGVGGATWYEQQQVALDKQRIADAEAAQAAQLAYQHQQQQIAESNAVEAANQAYRDLQLKSTYATSNGMAYASPKGSPFAQQLPEPSLLKQAYADNGQPDPWNSPAMVGGYTGSTFMNAQQPGITNAGDPSMQIPTSGAGSVIPSQPSTQPSNAQLDAWHAIAHQIAPHLGSATGAQPSQGGPVGAAIPSMASGGTVPGSPGQPQLIVAHGGETIIPRADRAEPTMATPYDVASDLASHQGMTARIPGYAMGGVVPDYSSAFSPTDFSQFMAWHDGIHARPAVGSTPSSMPPIPSNYGQSVGQPVHAPVYNDITAGQGRLSHQVYSPVLTGLSGYGATMTPNGTPVVMSNYQRSHLMPSSISGPNGYEDYAMQVANWSPADLKSLGDNITGNFAKDLTAPVNYAPIAVTPAPSGG